MSASFRVISGICAKDVTWKNYNFRVALATYNVADNTLSKLEEKVVSEFYDFVVYPTKDVYYKVLLDVEEALSIDGFKKGRLFSFNNTQKLINPFYTYWDEQTNGGTNNVVDGVDFTSLQNEPEEKYLSVSGDIFF